MHTNGQQDEESRVRDDSIAFVAQTQNIFPAQVFGFYKISHGRTEIMASEVHACSTVDIFNGSSSGLVVVQ